MPTTSAELAEYKPVGAGVCLDEAGKYPRCYFKAYVFRTISECRGLCTSLSAACVGYAFAVSGLSAGDCRVYGSTLPDEGMGAAARGKPLDGWSFDSGDGGSDTLTRASDDIVWECHAKQPGVSRIAETTTTVAATPTSMATVNSFPFPVFNISFPPLLGVLFT